VTIITHGKNQINEPSSVALNALAWILSDDQRAQRFLDLTGLTPDGLRDAVSRPSTHRAVLDFLCAHEPDLVEASEALDLSPAELAGLRQRIGS